MSFKSIYRDCLKSNIQALVVRQNGKDTLLGYRAVLFNPADETKWVYDFAVSSELFSSPESEDLHEFLSKITKSIDRVCLVDNGHGKLVSKQELASRFTITELSSRTRILKLLSDLRDVYVVSGKYSLRKGV